MHNIGWKVQFFNSADVSMLVHGCGVSQYPQFYDRIKKISNVTTSICGNLYRWKGSPIFAITIDYCIIQISWNICYGFNKWHSNYKILANLGSMMDESKEKIPKQCRIDDTRFKSLETLGVNLFTRHPKNLNHVHKYSNDLLSVIIILGKNVHGGEPDFYDGENMNDIGKRAHVLKH